MFIVVFRNRKRADIDADAYAVDAARMERLARTQLGFVSFKSYHADDGEVLALSEWESEEAALGWRRQVAHIEVQGRSRDAYYQDYTLYAGNPTRTRRFCRDGG
ncbi:MAG: polysaccharide biosynthesis protein [Novosphingobium sp. SCN 66-18]|nr:MAG: polysaccharide biosynthesis protein [Novosphingobium sp. SCN 66-18]